MSDNLMDTAPGGETPQYESIKTQTVESDKQSGQLGGLGGEHTADAEEGHAGMSLERGEKTAENVRYGQNVSESGMGGKTTTSSGDAAQGGYGGEVSRDVDPQDDTRPEQGYGAGSGVGA